jgi:uncharacterized LabA/DUF88 family protein
LTPKEPGSIRCDSLYSLPAARIFRELIPHGSPSGPHGFRPVGFFIVRVMKRISVYIDGFNLYHALKRIGDEKVKWLNLKALSDRLISNKSERIISIYYFSAFAYWLSESKSRHEEYVNALRASGIIAIIGQFKEKDRECHNCGFTWKAHEEKETDVSIGITLVSDAYKDKYDKALLLTRDSDLVPAVKMVRKEFSMKEVEVVAPPRMGHSNDLISVCTSKKKISLTLVNECLFPKYVYRPDGTIAATRPKKYD